MLDVVINEGSIIQRLFNSNSCELLTILRYPYRILSSAPISFSLYVEIFYSLNYSLFTKYSTIRREQTALQAKVMDDVIYQKIRVFFSYDVMAIHLTFSSALRFNTEHHSVIYTLSVKLKSTII